MLTLVATPIGNLGDITLRALQALKEADIVASEDTRKTGILLKHFEISKPQLSFHSFNERRAGEKILQYLSEGKRVALVTDAGTPGIADPGYSIVRRALDAGLPCTMVPGPTALIMAIVLSGLPAHSFTFLGFPPRKPGPLRRFFEAESSSQHTLVLYESPHRIIGSLRIALEVLGDRSASLSNDLTKKFESVWRGPLSSLLNQVEQSKVRGEYVLVIAGTGREGAAEECDE